MKKTMSIVVLALVVLFGVSMYAMADVYGNTRTVSVEKTGVQTSAGVKTIPVSTQIGGHYNNHIFLAQDTEFETVETGREVLKQGMEINCDHEPEEPDPCL